MFQVCCASASSAVSSVLLREILNENPSLLAVQATAIMKCLALIWTLLASPLLRSLPDSTSAMMLSPAHKKSLSLADYVSCFDSLYNFECCQGEDGSDGRAATANRSHRFDSTSRSFTNTEHRRRQLDLLAYSLLAGTLNFFGAVLAVLCVERTSAGQSAFLISFFVVFMPFGEWLVFRALPSRLQVGCLAIALGGIYMVSGASKAAGFQLSAGAYYGVLSAVLKCLNFLLEMCSAHLAIDRVSFLLGMLIVASALSLSVSLIDTPAFWLDAGEGTLQRVRLKTWVQILFLSINAMAGFSLQQFGLRNIASGTQGVLCLACSSPVSSLLAFLFIGEVLNAEEYAGCGLVFLATVLSLMLAKDKKDAAGDRSSSIDYDVVSSGDALNAGGSRVSVATNATPSAGATQA